MPALAAIPFAVWFFGCIDGVAMAAEEARNPRRSIPRAYIGSIVTLVLLAFGVMIFAGGTGDWRQIANKDAPLPEAMKIVVGENSGWLHMMVWLGLGGLVASFHGIILGYSRQIFAQAREGYVRYQIDEALSQANAFPNVVAETPNSLIAAALVAQGLGISIVSGWTAEVFAHGDIVTRPLEGALASRLAIIFPESTAISSLARAFATEVANALSHETDLGAESGGR
ncbi:amino acid permease [Burkholderia cenocepacia]|nr:amino acid permease [Burkholderia cenocepacia]RQU61183.1 amino acid permease [Burkholderia cenocepacia]RQV48622.1 amino acid permease [Burkholderia cenocepacia]